jgi:isoquinoline 1-oxidoreductase alpha subunit
MLRKESFLMPQDRGLPTKSDAIVPEQVRSAIELTINRKPFRHAGDPQLPLLWYLRDVLRLTGTKYGGPGSGADLVLVDGKATAAAELPLSKLDGKQIITVEGLADDQGKLHPLQQAFIDEDAIGCGYCTAGWLIAGVDLLKRNPAPDDDAIDQLPNLCLCGCQTRVRSAIHRAAGVLKGNRA